MKLLHGKVIAGKIQLEGEPLDEGTTVAVLVHHEDDASFSLSPADAAELARRIEQMRRGDDFVDGEKLLDELSRD